MLDRIREISGDRLDHATYHAHLSQEMGKLRGVFWKLERSQVFREPRDPSPGRVESSSTPRVNEPLSCGFMDELREFEGRALVRPDEEVVDQGLGFDLGTLVGRRRMLGLLGLGAVGLGLAACGGGDGSPSGSSSGSASAGTSSGEIPDEMAGPYPGDGSNGPDVLEQSGIVRSDIRSSFGTANGTADGVPMTLEMTISDLAKNAAPFVGAAVYVWHCDRDGAYSMYSDGVKDENYLRGVQIADGTGKVRFTSTFPGCYPGRWPHIHFEVYAAKADIADATKTIAISQIALPKDACDKAFAQPGYQQSVQSLAGVTLDTDGIFREDKGARQMATVTGDVSGGFNVSLNVGVDTRTQPTGS